MEKAIITKQVSFQHEWNVKECSEAANDGVPLTYSLWGKSQCLIIIIMATSLSTYICQMTLFKIPVRIILCELGGWWWAKWVSIEIVPHCLQYPFCPEETIKRHGGVPKGHGIAPYSGPFVLSYPGWSVNWGLFPLKRSFVTKASNQHFKFSTVKNMALKANFKTSEPSDWELTQNRLDDFWAIYVALRMPQVTMMSLLFEASLPFNT